MVLQIVLCMYSFYSSNWGPSNLFHLALRLDNTGAWAITVYPSLLNNRVSEHVDLYIKLKLVIFSFI